jgi:hypothetical protein
MDEQAGFHSTMPLLVNWPSPPVYKTLQNHIAFGLQNKLLLILVLLELRLPIYLCRQHACMASTPIAWFEEESCHAPNDHGQIEADGRCVLFFSLVILSVVSAKISLCLWVLVIWPSVGEFRKTGHPRNVEFNKVLESCFAVAGNSRFSEAWNLWSLEFANVQSSGILIRWRSGVTNMRKPGISNYRWPELRRTADSGICRGLSSGIRRVDMREPAEKRRPTRETTEDPAREFHAKTFTNQERSKVKVVVPKSPGLECKLVADL